jgi:transcriptional regulator of acetoin/glycerol metabolism
MPGGVNLRPEGSSDSWLALARERFLTAEPIEPGLVRDTILASWWRCREGHVAADHIDLSYVRDPDRDTPLARSALPILQNLRETLQGEPVSVVLADRAGAVLSRLTADHDLERHLDGVQLAPGFSYAEEFAGTNGIGMALESGRRTCSATSTTPSSWGILPTPACRFAIRSPAR